MTSAVFLVRPRAFGSNPETAGTNLFQATSGIDASKTNLLERSRAELDGLAACLEESGVEVTVFEDTDEPSKPDAVFPNNWISVTWDRVLRLYPLLAPNRRPERRADIVHTLEARFEIDRVDDWTEGEVQGRFLEGTGSVVLDPSRGQLFASLSPRTHPELVQRLACELGLEPVVFEGRDRAGHRIYHTNVIASVGPSIAVACLETIDSVSERARVEAALRRDGRALLVIDFVQLGSFAGNQLQLVSGTGQRIFTMSERAAAALGERGRDTLREHGRLVTCPFDTIETIGGGSVRCAITEIEAPPR